MRLSLLSFLALQVTFGVYGSPIPDSEEAGVNQIVADGFEQLAALASSAFEETKSEVESGKVQKRGADCTWYNVRVRREWCVMLHRCRHFLMVQVIDISNRQGCTEQTGEARIYRCGQVHAVEACFDAFFRGSWCEKSI